MSKDTQYIFVVHTKKYSGNFERELCGYITGQVGECGVGDNTADEFKEEVSTELQELFDEMIEQVPDEDNGCYRPCVIWPTPGRYNNGRGGHFDLADFNAEDAWGGRPHPAYESVAVFFTEQPTPEMIALMKERATVYGEEHSLGVTGFQLIKRETVKSDIIITDDEISI